MRRRPAERFRPWRVCAVSGRSHAVGVLADAGHEELYLAQIFFQGADAGHILAVGGLIDQLVVDLLLGVAVGELSAASP